MRVIEVVASLAEQSAGPSYSVPRLSTALAGAGADVSLCSLGKPGKKEQDGVRHCTFGATFERLPLLSQIGASQPMRASLYQMAESADVLHAHGLWRMANIYAARAAQAANKAFILSPRGMLGGPALAFSKFRKQVFWMTVQRDAAASATLFHATSDQEAEDIRIIGLRNPIAVIPNGIDVPPYHRPTRDGPRTVLSLGRIHPKKGLDRLIEAWAMLGPARDGWRLRIVGPSEHGHADELRALAASNRLSAVDIEGPVYGAEKLATHRHADVFVLPTRHENFALTVAEALAVGTPAIATIGSPWAGLVTHQCGWWVDHGPEPIAAALREAMSLAPERLVEMGTNGRAWMLRDFSWDQIGVKMLSAYEWAAHGGAAPSFLAA